jgi:hypothetical protein
LKICTTIHKTYSKNDLQPGESFITIVVIGEAISLHIFSDIGDELAEVSHLEEFVECNQLEVDNSLVADHRWRRSVGKSSMGVLFDLSEFTGTWIWQSVGQVLICFGRILGRRSSGEKWDHAQESDGG